MSNTRPELHVAQQIRRDRLRIQNSSRHLEQDFPSSLEQLSLCPAGISSDLEVKSTVRNANMLYEPVLYSSSEMVNFSTDSNHLAESSSRLMTTMPQFASFPYSSNPASSSFHTSLEEQCEVRDLGYWMPNESNPNLGPIFGVEINNELPGVQSCSPSNPSCEMATRESRRLLGDIHPNVMQGSSEMTSLTQQTGRGMWVGNGNQLFFLTNYGVQSNQLRLGNPNSCTNRTMGGSLGCEASDEYSGRRVSESNNQGLSLSLSSNSQSAPCRSSDDHQSRRVLSKDPQYSKPLRSLATLSSNAGDRVKSLQNMVVGIPSSNIDYRNVGPLGPFTGYATILKNSSFLKPAQELLEEICGQSNEKLTKGPDVSGRVSGEVGSSISADAVNPTIESGVRAKSSSSVGSFSMLHCSNGNEMSGDGGTRSSSRPSSWPEYQQIMARFLYMQEEVIRRYKQHQQQMQMVIPSFESVTGLSSATPYISKALKSVSRHFRYLENAISDQVKHIREALGEELSASTSGCGVTSTSGKLDSNIARLKFLDQSFQKNKYVVGGTSYVEQQQPAWRPQQKGLPERAVSVLRAWLFDHFLHPYPTDSDKHMLAARTGLSRNQVSNWFINARVRVWKPMVEEIHLLETKGLTRKKDDAGNGSKNEGSGAIEGGHQPELQEEEVVELNPKECNQEKRSKLECQMEGTLMGFVPYRRGEVEVGGGGPVSLTLALKHGDVEAIQQHHRHQLRRARHQ